MAITDNLRQAIGSAMIWALSIKDDEYESEYARRAKMAQTLGAYYAGLQSKSLRPSAEGKDFNLIVNYSRLIVDRSVTMLVGGGVDFLLEDGPKETIDAIWRANHKDILLHDLTQLGTIYGTGYIKLIPNGNADGSTRLVALNPLHMIIGTSPHDVSEVQYYVIRYNGNMDGQETAFREITRRNDTGAGWRIITQHANHKSGGRWVTDNDLLWAYDFPPIAHVKNLPNAGEVYGYADLMGIVDLQDDYNANISNTNKILWFHGHPRLWTNGNMDAMQDWSPTKILQVKGENAKIDVIQPVTDLGAARQFAEDLRRDMMEISRTTDVSTIKDAAGQLTNFTVRLMFQNELAKRDTKRLLYGDFLQEVNRRLLALDNVTSDGGTVVWGDVIPTNEAEEMAALKTALELGLVSKQTAAERLDYDFETEQERMTGEQAQTGNVGALVLGNFMRGQQ